MNSSLVAFTAYRQFVIYRLEASQSRPGKTDKFPIDYRTGAVANAHDPSIWLDCATAEATAQAWGHPYGVGFVFTEQDPFWFFDIDDCRNGSEWSSLALSFCQYFAGAAIEVSQSGNGLHIFGTGTVPAHSCRNTPLGMEFYDKGRFAAFGGNEAVGDASFNASALLPAFVAAYFPPDEAASISDWTDSPSPEWNGPTDDGELIRRAMLSRSTASAFGNRASFADLWTANEQILSVSYPDAGGRPFDCSMADAALAQHLAFWTGKDCARVERLMRQSGLVRDKWERGGSYPYLRETIIKAVSRQIDVLEDKRIEAPGAPIATGEAPKPQGKEGSQILAPSQQIEFFRGCVYVRDQHRALTPGGLLLKPDQFRVQYGGFIYQLDLTNEKISRDAWEAWTQSQAFACPKVDGTCFRPDLAPGEIIQRGSQSFVNTYFPVPIERKAGDASPFLNHLAKVLPDRRDQLILLSYMAACVQRQGAKFQWAPLLQGVEGNGKTLFARCVAEAVGPRYVHWPKASKLANQFNSWMVGKVFYAVEDIYVPDARREVVEELKPMITGGDGLEIEAKGVDQISADICGNFMFNSNHKDAVKKTANDRRFCLLFSAQQKAEDLERDGMGGDYFPRLYDWLRADGYAIVSELLWTYSIPKELNPAGECQRAPVTTTTEAAIQASAGSVEQEIEEAIAQGLQGFSGGWISSIWLERLLDRLNLSRKITHNKRRELLEQMGYVLHPALPGGRTNNSVLPEGGKPRLFVRSDSLALQIHEPAGVAKAYETANIGRNAVALPFASHR